MTDEIVGFRTAPEEPASAKSIALPPIGELLCELRLRASRISGGRHAELALAALGELISNPAEHQAATGRIASARASPAENLTPALIEPLVAPLGEMARSCESGRWCELVLTLLDHVPVEIRKPAQVLQLALYASAAVRPVLLAEYWHLVMAGLRHDPVYVSAVALDVWGDALSNPPQLLARTLAAAAVRRPRCSPWRVRRPEHGSRGRGPAAAVETALEALASIPEPLEFVKGWGLARLKPLLADAGALEKGVALARQLSNRFDIRTGTLRRLTGEVREAAARPPATRGGRVSKVRVPCDFGSHRREFPVYFGRPAPGFHPLCFQAAWLRAERDGVIPDQLMDRLG